MRPIDADALYDKAEAWYKNAHTPYRKIYRSFIDIIADAPTIDPPPNDPLTLEQLREMGGQAVWVSPINGESLAQWMLVSGYTRKEIYLIAPSCHIIQGYARKSYGKTWLAYRRKPEEGT